MSGFLGLQALSRAGERWGFKGAEKPRFGVEGFAAPLEVPVLTKHEFPRKNAQAAAKTRGIVSDEALRLDAGFQFGGFLFYLS